ncbi:hypothetical protein GQ55_5G414600 [Panicum hallii var. hallii]|uniref:Uncharacterized protein n=1 Tax=Panicum hallii var. hallii TaxID=1504633 RepID=A0A2T7DNX4_9POAL|nr:hypothetical protein GQ55_5G414600 [Panicum hallii var. hallii]
MTSSASLRLPHLVSSPTLSPSLPRPAVVPRRLRSVMVQDGGGLPSRSLGSGVIHGLPHRRHDDRPVLHLLDAVHVPAHLCLGPRLPRHNRASPRNAEGWQDVLSELPGGCVCLRVGVEGALLLVRLVAAGVVLLCSSKRSRGETGGALIVGSEWKKEAMVLASCVNSRREKRQRRWLVRLSDLRKERDRWCLSCSGRSREGRGARSREERRGGLLLEKKRSTRHRGVKRALPHPLNVNIQSNEESTLRI